MLKNKKMIFYKLESLLIYILCERSYDMSSPEQLHISFHQMSVNYDINLVKNGKSEYSVKINGMTYAVLGEKEKLEKACEILNSVSLESISNSEDLQKKLVSREDISFPIQKIDDLGIDVLKTKTLRKSNSTKIDTPKSTWLEEENIKGAKEGRLVAEKYWELNGNKDDHTGLMGFLSSRLIGEDQTHLIKEFEIALKEKNKEKFISLFENIPRAFIDSVEAGENLQVLPMRTFTESRKFTEQDKENLEVYMQDSGFSGLTSITSKGGQLTVKTESIEDLDAPFAMHSIGKVFTGMLLMSMIQQGIISEKMIDEPLELEDHVIKELSKKGIPKESIEKMSLRQVMQHTSGLGDYLGNYQNAIKSDLETGQPLPTIEKPEDLLRFADKNIKTLEKGERSYSNLGSLLFGLSIQHHYNKKLNLQIKKAEKHIEYLKNKRDHVGKGSAGRTKKSNLNTQIQVHEERLQKLKSAYLPYSKILRKEIISPAGLESFSEKRPLNAHYHDKDPNAHLYGGPAGGYWISVKDLDKFGQFICKQYSQENSDQETSLHQLLEKYGEEFYGGGVIEHNGAVPSGSGHFSVFLNQGTSVAVLSDQSRLRGNFSADSLYYSIYQNLLTKEEGT